MRFLPRQLPAVDAAAFVRAGFENLPAAPRPIEALVHAPAASVRPSVGPWATVEEVDELTCRLRMSVENLDWPALALGAAGAEFEVIQPPELIDHLRDWARRFTRATTSSATS
jgi:predicted DNA-binding transcriptional regulator YafY